MKPLLITSGEPAGIGPDIIIQAAQQSLPAAIVVYADADLLRERARILNLSLDIIEYHPAQLIEPSIGQLCVWHHPLPTACQPGVLNEANASWVVTMLGDAAMACMHGDFSALITAPVHKEIINRAGIPFSGHTELLAEVTGSDQVVMMLACDRMKVALVTTHVPLSEVPGAVTQNKILSVSRVLDTHLKQRFAIEEPQIYVAGLNPHAGEGGYLGHEELDTISPALERLRGEGIAMHGPLPADTMFTPPYVEKADAFLAMYHDQGLSVLKYAGFGESVNVSLGLPIVRTSVDHGTALDLAGSSNSRCQSLLKAIEMAAMMCLGGSNAN